MENVAFLIFAGLMIYFFIWLYILLPAQMAEKRHRSPGIWVLISLVGSPLLAVLLLMALGDADA